MKKVIISIYFLMVVIHTTLSFAAQQSTSKVSSSAIKDLMASYAAAITAYFAKPSTLYPSQTHLPSPQYYDMIPITEYLGDTSRLNLFLGNKNEESVQKIPTKQWEDVISYQLSPAKKYLFIQTTVVGFFGKYAADAAMKLVDLSSLKEITSFTGRCVMYEWSPDETSLIIARAQKGFGEQIGFTQQKEEGASLIVGEQRSQPATGEILRYELFDIASQTILKTFENIKLLTYETDTELIVKYDNGEIKKIEIRRDIPLSMLQKLFNFFKKQSTIQVTEKEYRGTPLYTADYDLKFNTLTLTAKNQKQEKFKKILSYSISPKHNYMLINQIPESVLSAITEIGKAVSGSKTLNSETTLFNINDGTHIKLGYNVVTHMFSSDEKSLLFFGAPLSSKMLPETVSKQLPLNDPVYQVMTIETKTIQSLEDTRKIRSAYFTPTDNLVLINADGMKEEKSLKPALIPSETAQQAVKARGLEAIRASLPEAIKAGKEMASGLVEKAQTAFGTAQEKAKEFATKASEYVLPPAPKLEPADIAPTKIETQKEAHKKIYEELPGALQKIVPSENVSTEEKEESMVDQESGTEFEGETYFDMPDNESDDEDPSIYPIETEEVLQNKANNNS